MAYKRELMVNGGQSLTSYKKYLKVSDVCQLLDKRDYKPTRTMRGVTFTNNGDGTITVNGTSTSQIYEDVSNSWIPLDTSHKYLLSGCPKEGGSSDVFLYVNNGDSLFDFDTGNGSIGTVSKNRAVVTIAISGGTTVNNLVFKPQLFDLTEMYGEGNEPKTVAEFRAKFPNELYDYSPRCWVTSYKTGLIAKTKNLFDVSKLTAYTPETLPNNRTGIYNGNIIARAGEGNSICYSAKTLKELCPDLVAGEEYVLSFKTNGTYVDANVIDVRESGTLWRNGSSKIVTQADLDSQISFYANYPDLTVATISEFQIEKGSTATDYVPYGCL